MEIHTKSFLDQIKLYKKDDILIEAIKLDKFNINEVVHWCQNRVNNYTNHFIELNGFLGETKATLGDYIVKDLYTKDYYVFSAAAFKKLYDI